MTSTANSIRTLSLAEIDAVSGGENDAFFVVAGLLGTLSATSGLLAMFPGPHSPAAAAISGLSGLGATMFGLYGLLC